MSEITVYLGESERGTHVYADVRVEPGEPGKVVTFMDHSTGPAPERVSICFTELKRKGNPRTAPDSWHLGGGQIPPEDRRIAKTATPHLELIERAWATQHLNDMHAECDHMTPEMLEPTPEQIAAYAAENPRTPSYSLIQYWRLDTVVCPESGYRYGRSWLASTPDPEIVAALKAMSA